MAEPPDDPPLDRPVPAPGGPDAGNGHVSTVAPVAGPADPERAIDERLARLHLRTGAYPLARAELETLAGSGDLQLDTIAALAEARWRTGDLVGAGQAARVHLDRGGDALVAFAIAAEAAVAGARPSEARRLASRVLERADVPLDSLFAGMPRSGIWPHDARDPGEPAGTLFSEPSGSGPIPTERARLAGLRPSARPPLGPAAAVEGEGGPGLWDESDVVETGPTDAQAELAAGFQALEADDEPAAAVHFAIALRLSPALAPLVIDAAGRSTGPAFELLRGDAYRLVGHEAEARHAYQRAAAALRRSRADRPAEQPGPTTAAGPAGDRPFETPTPEARTLDTAAPTIGPATTDPGAADEAEAYGDAGTAYGDAGTAYGDAGTAYGDAGPAAGPSGPEWPRNDLDPP